MSGYLLNNLLLILPILLWNLVLAGKLPQAFQAETFDKDIPGFILLGENVFRLVIFILPACMPLSLATPDQKLGLALYLAGTLLYFLAWAALIAFPQARWSKSAFGFLAPAYTPLIWLTGIGMIGNSLYFSSPYRTWMYILAAIIFAGFHVTHTSIVYLKTREIAQKAALPEQKQPVSKGVQTQVNLPGK